MVAQFTLTSYNHNNDTFKEKRDFFYAFPIIGQNKHTFPNIFLPFMAARAAAAFLCSKNSTKQYGSLLVCCRRKTNCQICTFLKFLRLLIRRTSIDAHCMINNKSGNIVSVADNNIEYKAHLLRFSHTKSK